MEKHAKVQCNTCGKWLVAIPPVRCCGVLILDQMASKEESRIERLRWYIKQLLPLTHITTFTENGRRRLCIWNMWLGQSFNVRYFDLAA